MELKEIQACRIELENDIALSIMKFIAETGISPRSVEIQMLRVNAFGKPITYTVGQVVVSIDI
jgi:hypothetical protein